MATKTFQLPLFVDREAEASQARRGYHSGPKSSLILSALGLLEQLQVLTRTGYRALLLVLSLLVGVMRFTQLWLTVTASRKSITSRQRAEWMHFCGTTVLSAIGVRYRVEGKLPRGTTLIVANHLSYLDIAVFSAALPCAFVAKHEIAAWPGFGSLASIGGAIFVDRESRMSASVVMSRVHARLLEEVSVLVFPEGTSTDGSTVERFHPTLLEAAIRSGKPITTASVTYEPVSASVFEKDLCWFGDELFVPHLRRVLGIDSFTAVVRFGESEVYPDRKAAAWRAHDAVDTMRRSVQQSLQRAR